MEPPLQTLAQDDFALGGNRQLATEYHALAGWPAQPKLVPTVVLCERDKHD